MHRGLIALHTAGSLNVGEAVSPPPPATAKGRTRRGSSSDGNLGDQTLRHRNVLYKNTQERTTTYGGEGCGGSVL